MVYMQLTRGQHPFASSPLNRQSCEVDLEPRMG